MSIYVIFHKMYRIFIECKNIKLYDNNYSFLKISNIKLLINVSKILSKN